MRLAVLLVCLALVPAAWAKTLVIEQARVTRVADGDSYFVDVGGPEPIEVRVAGIDCPESTWPGRWAAQPFAPEAKAFATTLLQGRQVRLELKDKDRYGRRVGQVVVDGKSMGVELVRAGLAWWNPKYAAHDAVLSALQDEARSAHRGLWKDPDPVAPWDYRHRADAAKTSREPSTPRPAAAQPEPAAPAR